LYLSSVDAKGEFLSKLKVAVVDNDRTTWEQITNALVDLAELDTYCSTEELLRAPRLQEYECFVVDFDAGRALHQLLMKKGEATPIIYVAARPTIPEAVAAIKLGAIDFLGKPVDAGQLRGALAAVPQHPREGMSERFFDSRAGLDATLDMIERELIHGALARSGGIVGGLNGAAAILGVTRTGLLYKMKRLGITRRDVGRGEAPSASLPEIGQRVLPQRASSSTTA
jgi:DNA-binding NtrC family response regulator